MAVGQNQKGSGKEHWDSATVVSERGHMLGTYFRERKQFIPGPCTAAGVLGPAAWTCRSVGPCLVNLCGTGTVGFPHHRGRVPAALPLLTTRYLSENAGDGYRERKKKNTHKAVSGNLSPDGKGRQKIS